MSSTGHAIRDPFFDRSHRLIAQLLPVERQRRHGCAPGTSSPGQGFQNPCRNGGLCIRESIHQVVKFFSGAYLHGSNLAHPSRPDPVVPAGKRRPENRQATSAQRSACEKRRQPNGIDRQLFDSPSRSLHRRHSGRRNRNPRRRLIMPSPTFDHSSTSTTPGHGDSSRISGGF